MNQLPNDRYAVFGSPIKHSKSPFIHQSFAAQTKQNLSYTAEQVSPESFIETTRNFFANYGKGLNCTVPLKELAWKLADTNTERANLAKAVNTLCLEADGSIKGDNTDGIGLITDLTVNHQIKLLDSRILILGAGGATRGIIAPLLDLSPQMLVIANRTTQKAIDLAKEFSTNSKIYGCSLQELSKFSFDLIINATSASLTGDLPTLPDHILDKNGNCYDLAYSDQDTAFVKWGKKQNAKTSLDGLGMLVEQAAEAFYIWRGVRPKTAPVIEILNNKRYKTELHVKH